LAFRSIGVEGYHPNALVSHGIAVLFTYALRGTGLVGYVIAALNMIMCCRFRQSAGIISRIYLPAAR
jgi:hypothetical protein